MHSIQNYLRKAEEYHGHICSGQILGIRMAILGLNLLRLKPEDNLRDLVVFLETDRCVADAVYVVTGVTVGRRRIKMFSYGKTAMSFLNLATGKAFRICVKTCDRPPHGSSKEQQIAFWNTYGDDELFSTQEVRIEMSDGDLPGPPVSILPCECCGEDVLDHKEILKNGKSYCRACAEGAYYQPVLMEKK